MISQTPFRHYARIAQHFVSTRALEVCALQASPILGAFLGGFNFLPGNLIRFGLLMFGSLALTAHVFVFNDWAGYDSDLRDPQRKTLVLEHGRISRQQIAYFAGILLILAFAAFAAIGVSAILIGAGIAILSFLYSCSSFFGKSTPIAASLNHLIGGVLHFLLGYTAFHKLDERGFLIGLFFGLVFAAGHLNQEIRDYEADFHNKIRTSAVVFGCRRTFFASLSLFSIAYAILVVLAVAGILPKLMLWSIAAWVLQIIWSWQAWRRGLNFETALWIQRRYRLLFALIGLTMLMSA